MGETKKGKNEKPTKIVSVGGKYQESTVLGERISKIEKQIFSSIDEKAGKNIAHLERLEDELTLDYRKKQTTTEIPKIRNEQVEDAVGFRMAISKARTYVGVFKAKTSVKMYTTLARYYASRGDDKEQEELLKKARKAARKKMFKLQNKNQSSNNNIRKIVKKADEVRRKTENYDIRKQKEDELESRRQEVEDGPIRGRFDKKVAKREKRKKQIMDRAKERIAKGADLAEKVEEFLYDRGTDAAVLGMDSMADTIADHSAAITNLILQGVEVRNEIAYARLNRKAYGFKENRVQSKAESINLFRQVGKIIPAELSSVSGFWNGLIIGSGKRMPQPVLALVGKGKLPQNIAPKQPVSTRKTREPREPRGLEL